MQATSPAGDGTVVTSQLTHSPISDRIFLELFSTDFFLCGYCAVFSGLANRQELLRFFDDLFKLTINGKIWTTVKIQTSPKLSGVFVE